MTRRSRGGRRRGIVGIEAAIVLIAFVIVAAALAFVTLNMGFFTTQKSQQVIAGGLGEASTALEVDGSVLAYSTSGSAVDYLVVPIKVSPGRSAVDLHPNRSSIMYWSGGASFADIYVAYGYIYYDSSNDVYKLSVYNASGKQLDLNKTDTSSNDAVIGGSINITKVYSILTNESGTLPAGSELVSYDIFAAVLWVNSNQQASEKDTNLEIGEKAIVLVIYKDGSVKPEEYATVKLEIKPPEGASLTVERTMPPGISVGVMDLG